MIRNIFALLIAISFVGEIFAARPAYSQKIRLSSMILGEGLQKEDRSGLYGEIITEILSRTGSTSELLIVPLRRALRMFFSKDVDCIWGMDIEFLRQFRDDDTTFSTSDSLLESYQYIFQPGGAPPLHDISEIAGKTIGVLNGANTEKLFMDAAAHVVHLPNQETKVRMLLSNRIDMIGGWTPDIYITLNSLDLPMDAITPSYKLGESSVRIVCHPSDNANRFLSSANAEIRRFKASEAFGRILAEYGVTPESMR